MFSVFSMFLLDAKKILTASPHTHACSSSCTNTLFKNEQLLEAAEAGDIATVAMLLDTGADVNTTGGYVREKYINISFFSLSNQLLAINYICNTGHFIVLLSIFLPYVATS